MITKQFKEKNIDGNVSITDKDEKEYSYQNEKNPEVKKRHKKPFWQKAWEADRNFEAVENECKILWTQSQGKATFIEKMYPPALMVLIIATATLFIIGYFAGSNSLIQISIGLLAIIIIGVIYIFVHESLWLEGQLGEDNKGWRWNLVKIAFITLAILSFSFGKNTLGRSLIDYQIENLQYIDADLKMETVTSASLDMLNPNKEYLLTSRTYWTRGDIKTLKRRTANKSIKNASIFGYIAGGNKNAYPHNPNRALFCTKKQYEMIKEKYAKKRE